MRDATLATTATWPSSVRGRWNTTGKSGVEETVPRREAVPYDGRCPLIVFSHRSGATRLSSTFLGTYLASHGYVVAAMDHSEAVAPELAGRDDETEKDRAIRIDNIITGRVPDVRFLVDHLLAPAPLLLAVASYPRSLSHASAWSDTASAAGQSFRRWRARGASRLRWRSRRAEVPARCPESCL
jgi:Platelet-activating factor acetylhydrolase, isoform II